MKLKQLLKDANLTNTFWGKRILNAKSRGKFNKEDKRLARNWQTCACGKQDPRIPRISDSGQLWPATGEPVDTELHYLGVFFNRWVADHKFKKAAKTLVKIEKRAAEILAELPLN